MQHKNYLTEEQFDLMNNIELDCLDLDYQYDEYLRSMENMKEAISHHFWNEKVARNGMTYGQIQQLNDLELTLSR